MPKTPAPELPDEKNIIARISELKPPAAQPAEKALYLFASFDLVNSTKFKSEDNKWPVVISQFYTMAVREVQKDQSGFKVWKFVGDEVLFFKIVRSIEALAADIQRLYAANWSINDALVGAFPHTRYNLSVKSTVWCALCTQLQSGELEAALNDPPSNVLITDIVSEVTQRDFIGPDVDVGFRIAKYAHRNVLTVSAELTGLVLGHATGATINFENFRVISLQRLKGIWNERHYPIIWYSEKWSEIKNTFYYDQIFEDGFRDASAASDGKRDFTPVRDILEQTGHLPSVAAMFDAMASAPSSDELPPSYQIEAAKVAEVHCVAVCISDSGKALIAKRPASKRTLPGAWEFGCAQLRMGLGFEDAIREAYKEDFSITLGGISNLPVASYEIQGKGKKVPGIIFAASVTNAQTSKRKFSESKHSEVRWITEAEIADYPAGECVPDFSSSLRAAFEYWRANFKK